MARKLTMVAVAIAMVGALLSATQAEVTTKFSGDVLYRWQYDYHKYVSSTGDDSARVGDFSNKYWWNLKLAVDVNENLGFGIEATLNVLRELDRVEAHDGR